MNYGLVLYKMAKSELKKKILKGIVLIILSLRSF